MDVALAVGPRVAACVNPFEPHTPFISHVR